MSSIEYYMGSASVALKGKNCVVVGVDRRVSSGFQTIAGNSQRVFKINDKVLLALTGLQTDISTVSQNIKYTTNLYKLEENREIQPKALSELVSSFLYKHRFGPYFVQPIIAGLDLNNEPFISSMDSIGCQNDIESTYFLCGGSAYEMLLGACESFYTPDLPPNELFELCSQILLSATDRDALSGWGAFIYIMQVAQQYYRTPESITLKSLECRQD